MKNLSLLMLCLALISGTFLGGCKKGEEDPFISLRSRDARLKGEWKLSKYSRTATSLVNPRTDATITTVSTYDGTSLTTVATQQGNNTTTTVSFSSTLKIEDDGKYTYTVVRDDYTYTSSGSWYWQDSDKNRSYVIFENEYANEFGPVYLLKLKNDEMMWIVDSSFSSVSDDSSFSDEDASHTEYTWTAQ